MSNKTKNIGLIIGFVLVLVLSYVFAISKTFEQRSDYKDLRSQELLYKNAPKQLSLLKQKQRYYDSLLSKYQLKGSSIQNSLLKRINSFAESNTIKVVRFLEPHVQIDNELTIKTYEFVVEGNYNAINNLVYQLEQQSKFGEIINLHFEKKKNFRTGTSFLQARVLIRSFG